MAILAPLAFLSAIGRSLFRRAVCTLPCFLLLLPVRTGPLMGLRAVHGIVREQERFPIFEFVLGAGH